MIFYKLIFLIIFLIVLVRLKAHLALSILFTSILSIVIYNIQPKFIFLAAKNIFFNATNLGIIITIILVNYLGGLLSKRGDFR